MTTIGSTPKTGKTYNEFLSKSNENGEQRTSKCTQSTRFQTPFCICVWCFAVLYSIYRAIHSAQELYPRLSIDDFESGWEQLGSRPKDISDYEWAVFSQLMVFYLPWVVVHVIITNFLKHFKPNLLVYFFILSSVWFLNDLVGFSFTLLLLFQIFLLFMVQILKKKWLCWIVSGVFILCLNCEPGSFLKNFLEFSESREEYIMSVTISWTVCRCLSFCLLQCDKMYHEDKYELFIQMLAYVLYLPLLLTGPIVSFDDFQADLQRRPSFKCYMQSLINVIRYTIWFLFNVVIRHYCYFSALNYHPHLLENLSTWSLCGFALGMSQLFMLKYVVLFGFPSTAAQLEGFKAPSKPKCVARIHLYSDMWKYFDHGLYIFLKRFVYIPVVNSGHGKLFGGFLCFTFVYFWHGASKSIFIWTILNFLGITFENGAKSVAQTKIYNHFINKLPQYVVVQIETASMAFLLIMSAISNFYFICGYEIGNIFIKRILFSGILGPFLPIWFILTCMCHSSEAIKLWETTNHKLQTNSN